jgi:hypothetical protein
MDKTFDFDKRYEYLCSYYWDKETNKVAVLREVDEQEIEQLPEATKEKLKAFKEEA